MQTPSWLNDVLGAQNQLQNGSFGGGLTNNYLNNNAFGLGDNTYLNNNTFGLSENNYLNNNAFASNGHDSLFAPLPLNQNSVRFADNPATNMATANNLDWGVLFNALFGVKPTTAGTLDAQGINNQPEPFNYDSYDFDITPDINRHYRPLTVFEGPKDYIYFDPDANPTIGTGELLSNSQIRNNFVWPLKRVEQDELINDLAIMSPFFKPGAVFGNMKADSQIEMFKAFYEGKDVKTATNGKVESLPVNVEKAFRKIYRYHVAKEDIPTLARKHIETFVKPRIKLLLKKNNLKWENLADGTKDVILDLGFNSGKDPIDEWPLFNNALKNGDLIAAALQTHRKGIQASRNNYNLLRILPGINHLPVEEVLQMVDTIGEELTKDNFDQYKHIHKLEYNPFNH